MTPDEQPPLPADPPPEPPASSADEHLAAARVRRQLRLVPRPLAYCRPRADNDNGRRR